MGGGARFTDSTGVPRDGMLISSAPMGNPPTGWAATGSTQYTTKGGLGVGDRIQVYAVCAPENGLSVVTSTSGPVVLGLVSQSVECPVDQTALSGGVMFTADDGGPRDGMLMNDVPTGTLPAGWAATGSTQYTTKGGQGLGDHIRVSAVCAAGEAGAQVVTATSGPVGLGFVSQSVECPAGQIAVAGGVMFTDAAGAGRDGMPMNTVPIGSPPTGWAATGSTQYTTAGGQGVSDRIRVFAVCVP